MKPKLKVGDYAKVIKKGGHGLAINTVGSIQKIEGVKFPYKFMSSDLTWQWMNASELCKCSPSYDFLMPLTDLEQYRLSLEVYLDFIYALFYNGHGYDLSDNSDIDKLKTEILEDRFTIETLMQILDK